MSNYKRNEENKTENYDGGIYCITNNVNNKKYVGQTYDLKYRWNRHKSDLNCNRHHNKHLQSAWNKYGENSFTYSILEYCSIEILDDREIYWIYFYQSQNQTYGYNLADGGLGCRGYKHTEEEIMKMRMIQNPEPILQISLEGVILNEFVSAGEAGDYIGKESVSAIKRCCDGNKYKQAYGYIWIYKKDLPNFKLEDHITTYATDTSVMQYSIDNTYIKTWDTAKQGAKDVDGNPSEILKVCSGERKTYKGFIWKYTDNPQLYDDTRKIILEEIDKKEREKALSILQCTTTGQIIKRWDMARDLENSEYVRGSVESCCMGHMAWYKEYIWIYERDVDSLKDRITKLKNSKVLTIPILQCDEDENLVKEWKSKNSIVGFSKRKIERCLKEQTFKAEGYIWKYKYPELIY